MNTYKDKALKAHEEKKGKLEVVSKMPVTNREELAIAYTPGVGAVSEAIAENKDRAWELTGKGNAVAVVTDGSAVLGLGNIGPEAALPVMEGKAILFKEFAHIDAYPIVLNTQDTEEIIRTVKAISPGFAGINLEDISAPRCFEIEERLKRELDIPVFHDDQHGTAIVVLAGLINALRVTRKNKDDIHVVINGAGAAGIAITHLLSLLPVGSFSMVDSKGVVREERSDLNEYKQKLLTYTNYTPREHALTEEIRGADVFIGVSAPHILTKEMVRSMNIDPIIFAMANPIPEIEPADAHEAGAAVVATGRSDHPNQVNNVLAFPGIFRGLLDNRIRNIDDTMKIRAAQALASLVEKPTPENILPDPFDPRVVHKVALSVLEK